MRYINRPTELIAEMRRLMQDYGNYYWMVAWAGDRFALVDDLENNQGKIRKIAIGLHYFRTHPTFIETFNPVPEVRFVKNNSGIFLHSKVYLFMNGPGDWEVLIGSANFTRAAFHSNNEAAILIRADGSNEHVFTEAKASIEAIWDRAGKFDPEELEDYKASARNRKDEDATPEDPENVNPRPGVGGAGQALSWQQYVERIVENGEGRVRERIRLLDLVQECFRQYPVFSEMPDMQRKWVGGFVWKNQPVDFLLFGNMLNGTDFTPLVNDDPAGLSHALDAIPLEGQVTRTDFETYAARFQVAIGGGNKYKSATRLLAMKRPDVFFAISNGNNKGFARGFGVRGITTMTLARYWDDVVLRIQTSEWWQNPQPINEFERSISAYRAAFLDVLYYRGDT